MARPTKYAPKYFKAIVESLAGGCSRTAAANAAGIDYKTFTAWMREHEPFAAAVEEAEAQPEIAAVNTLFVIMRDPRANANAKVQAAVEFLKRRRRDEWGDKTLMEHSGTIATTVFGELSDDELAARIERLETRKAQASLPAVS